MPSKTSAQRPESTARRRIAARAARQWGVVTRAQLLEAGFSESAIARLLADGWLVRLHAGVYALGHAALRQEARWLAAILACGHGAVLSHRSAGVLWGLGSVRGGIVDVTAPRGRRRRPGIAAHEGRLDEADVTSHRGIPVTTVARTLLDLAGILPRADLERTVDQAIRTRRYDRAALDHAMARAHGRRELRPLRAVLEDLDPDRGRTRFELEATALPLILAAGLPRPRVNEHVEGHRVDLHWPEHRLVVELDGRTWHSDPTAFEADRLRDGDLLLAGWRVLRVTWRQLTRDRAAVVSRLRQLLA